MSTRGTCDERVRRMYRSSASRPVGLIAAGARGRLARRIEERESVQQHLGLLAFRRPKPALDLGDVDARRAECVAFAEAMEQSVSDRAVAA